MKKIQSQGIHHITGSKHLHDLEGVEVSAMSIGTNRQNLVYGRSGQSWAECHLVLCLPGRPHIEAAARTETSKIREFGRRAGMDLDVI